MKKKLESHKSLRAKNSLRATTRWELQTLESQDALRAHLPWEPDPLESPDAHVSTKPLEFPYPPKLDDIYRSSIIFESMLIISFCRWKNICACRCFLCRFCPPPEIINISWYCLPIQNWLMDFYGLRFAHPSEVSRKRSVGAVAHVLLSANTFGAATTTQLGFGLERQIKSTNMPRLKSHK